MSPSSKIDFILYFVVSFFFLLLLFLTLHVFLLLLHPYFTYIHILNNKDKLSIH